MTANPVLQAPILQPVVALVIWSFVMWAWLYATRIPAMRKLGVPMDPTRTTAELTALLPPSVRWKADNYNHLMEQPTLFYAVTLAIAVAGAGGDLANVGLAWTYVWLRVVHSLVQATANVIMARWAVFMAASLALLALTVRAAMVVWG